MPDQDEKKDESKEPTRPTNAALEFGLEDHEATQEDPRVAALKKADDARRLSTQSGNTVKRTVSQYRAQIVTPPPDKSPEPDSVAASPPDTPSELPQYETRTEQQAHSEDHPYNAATDFGLEETKATAQDPRVTRIMISERKPKTPTAELSKSQLPTQESSKTQLPEKTAEVKPQEASPTQESSKTQLPEKPKEVQPQDASPKEVLLPPAPPRPEEPRTAPKPVDTDKIPPPPPRPEDVRMPPPTMYSSGCVTGACPVPARPGHGRGKDGACNEACGMPCKNPNQTDVWKDPEEDTGNTKRINTDYTIDPAKEFTRTRTSTEKIAHYDVPMRPTDESEKSEKVATVSTREATEAEASASDEPDKKKSLMEYSSSESDIPSEIPPHMVDAATSGTAVPISSKEPPTVEELFTVASKQVKAAGAIALAANQGKQEYTTKEHEHDILTRTDNEVEEKFIREMSALYPTHKFIGEEAISKSETGQVELTDAPTWIIDPIDGTMNYVHHFPYYCISVALVINQRPEFGIVYNPPMDEMYTARRGKGAFLNGTPIKTSGQQSLEHALVLQEYSTGMNEDRNTVVLGNTKRLLKKTHAMRSIGSSAMGLAMVASGVADAFYYFGLHIWDMAAGVILVQEAGGVVIDPAGGELDLMSRRCLAAASMPLATELSDQLDQNYPSPRDDQPNSQTPKVETKDFFAQTDFTDSNESLTTDNSATPNKQKPPVHANQEV
ncbi:protein piccolo [Drosophila obscura]|uniref:protein piccolo n=1 Tax=Drosophila obscura TaxID=7282 RepID=UPI001BB2BB69|nr:protein piccolo [Drosophila obscura]